jgi:VWFA-related protein
MIRCGGWICLFCFSLCSGFAQQNSASEDRRMTLDVAVTDKSGKPVSGLEQQDFTLLDNKQPQKIVSFEAVTGAVASADPPVQVILLEDEVNTSFTNVSYERQQIEKFLLANGAKLEHPTSLVFLTDLGLTFGKLSSQDGNAVLADLKQHDSGLRTVRRRSQGVYGAGDQVQLSLNAVQQLAELEAARPGRKILIWISPGWPYLSGPSQELTSKDQRQIFGNIVGLSYALRRARITLYSVDPLGTGDSGGSRLFYYLEFVKPVKKPGQVQIGDLALQVLAVQSGGRVLNSDNDVAGEIESCVADANSFYVLTFDGLPADGPNEYHALDIKIDKPKLVPRTRSGYYAQP